MRIFLFVLMLVSLAGCGGFNPSFSNTTPDPGITPVDQDATGIWTGTIEKGGVSAKIYLLMAGGLIRGYSDLNNAVYYGTETVSRSSISGTISGADDTGILPKMTHSGIIISGKSIDWLWSDGSNVKLTYSPDTLNKTTIADVAGIWSYTILYNGNQIVTTNTIQPDGTFYGTDSFGCVAQGTVTQVGSLNLYHVKYTLSVCASVGGSTYEGLGTLQTKAATNDSIFEMSYDGTNLMWANMTRQ